MNGPPAGRDEQFGRARRLIYAGWAVLALLLVVALASRAHTPVGGGPPSSQRAPSARFLDNALSIVAAAGFLILISLALYTRSGRLERSTPASRAQRRLVSIVFLIAVIVGLALAGPHLRGVGRSRHAGETAPTPTRPVTTGTTTAAQPQARPYRPHFQWLPIALVLGTAGAAALAAGTVARRRGSRARGEERTVEQALAEVVGDSLDDLRGERDPRRAVIAAYARMERTLGVYGLPRRAFEAPLEYLARVLGDLRASAGSVHRLTDLFERAKFSRHEIDAGMKDEAIDALTAIRAELLEKP